MPTILTRSGLFTRAEARKAGFTAGQITHRIRSGQWQVVLGGVLSLRGLVITPQVRDLAAELAAPAAVLSASSAARRHGMEVPDRRTWLTVGRHGHCRLAGVQVWYEDLAEADLEFVDGALITSRARTVFDCLRVLDDDKADSLLDRALQQRWITFDELVARVQDFAGRRGVNHLVRVVRRAVPGARSVAERLLIGHLRAARVTGWRANFPVYDEEGLIGEIDLAFEDAQLAVEMDGRAWHSAGDRFQRDRERQNRLVAAGWKVLRYTWYDLTRRPEKVVAEIVHMVRRLSSAPGGLAA